MKSVMPSTFASSGCRRRITSLAEIPRLASGFSVTWMRPLLSVVFVPSMPMNDETLSTAGSRRITSASACCRSAMAEKDTDWGASEMPRMTPVSWIGKKPLGTTR